ncbi:hypothetical protein [Hymenobacter metallilatus]|uniref:Uncharacterized protein n=1 Tax=Hymenobacter metallilatus TaxID=2493666 RepID=A0A428JRF2_9BACT|nr:hypothetical protein [Hymenobacter metallilatus]RSK36107.1 hypothetical protein EI290_04245 [Hymenobacter metallilatus]
MSSAEVLYDVNLRVLPLEYLYARWQVRILHAGRASSEVWLHAQQMEFTDAQWHLLGPRGTLLGRWRVERDDLLGQPYLVLTMPEGEMQALVTRFRLTPSRAQRRLILYFQSGLEIELTHP